MLEHVERVSLGEDAIGERQVPQIAEREIDALPRFVREERADVDADQRRMAVAVPEQHAAAAAAEVDDPIAGGRPEEPAEHVVANAGRQERRRDRLMPRVGVERLVHVFRLLGECHAWPQVEIVAASTIEHAPATPGRSRSRAPAVERRPGSPGQRAMATS